MINIGYFLLLVKILHTSSLLQKYSHRLGRKSKTQNVTVPFCASLKNWPDPSPARFSFTFPRSGSRQHRSSTTMVEEEKPRRCFLVFLCFSLDSTAACLLSLGAYCRAAVTFVEVHKCHDCRHICLSTSCSALFVHTERLNHIREHPRVLSFNHQCCWGITNVSDAA